MLSLEEESSIHPGGEGNCRKAAQDPGHTEDRMALVVASHDSNDGFLEASAEPLITTTARSQTGCRVANCPAEGEHHVRFFRRVECRPRLQLLHKYE